MRQHRRQRGGEGGGGAGPVAVLEGGAAAAGALLDGAIEDGEPIVRGAIGCVGGDESGVRVGSGAEAGEHLGWTFSNRARYNLKATMAPGGGAPKDGKPYLFASDEVFLNFGRNIQYNIFDQNRVIGGVGFRFSKMLSAELSYLNQIVLKSNGTDEERHNIIVVGFSSEAPIRW